MTVSNTDNTSTASTATLALTTTNAGALPPVTFSTTVNTWSAAPTGTGFAIQRSAGTQVTFATAGERNFSKQAAASVRKTVTTSNATGDGTNATVTGYNASALFNQNSFWGGANTFTAPGAGVFLISGQGSVSSVAGFTSGLATITSTKHIILTNQCNVGSIRNASNNFTGVRGGSAVVNMAAFDTAIFTIKFSGSTKTASIQGVTGTNVITYFCGAKVS